MPTRWENQQEQAKKLGHKNAWEMRKAKQWPTGREGDSHETFIGQWKKEKRNIWKLDPRNCVEQAIDEIATPRFDRLAGQDGPVKIIMKDGMKYERSTSDYSGNA